MGRNRPRALAGHRRVHVRLPDRLRRERRELPPLFDADVRAGRGRRRHEAARHGDRLLAAATRWRDRGVAGAPGRLRRAVGGHDDRRQDRAAHRRGRTARELGCRVHRRPPLVRQRRVRPAVDVRPRDDRRGPAAVPVGPTAASVMTAVLATVGPDAGVAWHYGNPTAEGRALDAGTGVVDLSNREVVTISGSDRLKWLHSLASQVFEGLAPGVANTEYHPGSYTHL